MTCCARFGSDHGSGLQEPKEAFESYSLNSLKGGYIGNTIGVMKAYIGDDIGDYSVGYARGYSEFRLSALEPSAGELALLVLPKFFA